MTAAEKLAAAIRVPTVVRPDRGGDTVERLQEFQRLMQDLFPAVHRSLEVERPDPYRLVFRWTPSTATAAGRDPVLLMAHYDVVPAEPEGWSIAPFSGEIRDNAVWGRGALDNKLSMIGILQAVEDLLTAGYQPQRPFILAFGGDEEIGGELGAGRIAETLANEGVTLASVLDEGAIVADGMIGGITTPVGLIGCGEKGHINVRLIVESGGGHASNPPAMDPSFHLAEALERILRRRQPVRRTATVTAFIRALGNSLGGLQGAILRAYPFSAPAVHAILSRAPETDSMLRDSQAVTMLLGSDAPNVLPRRRWANINMRLLPGESIDAVLRRVRRRMGPRLSGIVRAELAPGVDNNAAPPESATDGPAYRVAYDAIRAEWPEIPILPYLVTATTDSRHYAGLSRAVLRFLPYVLDRDDLAGIHGVDERVSLANIQHAVSFYTRFIRLSDAEDL